VRHNYAPLRIPRAVRSTSKDIVRVSCCWIKDPALLGMVLRWTLAYAKCLRVSAGGGWAPFPRLIFLPKGGCGGRAGALCYAAPHA